ncbi:response regulator [Paraneptunicella aestuarii]|uniref:response regulator n=1 Tax=Paraneptunicella aestuarii TaxID=2831148 RepID=UPI001E3C2A74|nr:response regulator [Paraneptunicella aestuarii]UAA38882.1 response regulator [Paraneptunicella aestuarii]
MPQSGSSNVRILIVDDQKSNLTVLRDLLHEQGEIILAKSGAQCLEKAARLHPDLILLDVIMPEMNGFETLERLRANEDVADIPVMFITGLKDADHEQKGLMLGALDYIRKPFNPTVVKARVATHLQLSCQTKELKELSERLKESDAAKSLFLANMSHEIRTPLTSIIGYAEAIRSGDIPIEKVKGSIESICNNGEHLLQLVNDILDMSKIEASKLDMEMIDVVLPRCLMSIVDIVRNKAESKGLEFKVNLQFPLPAKFQTDPTRLKQILLNLLNNAVKFTSFGSVSLTIKSAIDRLIFVVEDTGIGIEQNQLISIFDAFAQAEKSTNRKYGGTGLGLNISKYLANQLGGDIQVESEIGKGSCFTLTTRLNSIPESDWLENQSQWSGMLGNSKAGMSWPHLSGRVLVAEDQPEIQQLIAMYLECCGLDVVAVDNGRDLVDLALANHVDLILTDIQMPGLSGIEAIGEMQSLGCQTPTIALTANAMVHQTEGYSEAGFIDYICKPFTRADFVQTICKYLSGDSQEERQLEHNIADGKKEIAQGFVNSLPEKMALTQTYFDSGNWKELGEVAHAVRGGALIFGYKQMGKFAEELERAALHSHQDVEEVLDLLESLQGEAANLCEKLSSTSSK